MGNLVIKGDNRYVLNCLNENYCKKVKCIYIDPPYNNGETYYHYSDKCSSNDWLSGMREVLERLYPLLSEDGSLWISIDDNEMHYLKVLADSIFGRDKFISTIIWQQRTSRENRCIFSNNHEYILVYAKNPLRFKTARNLIDLPKDILKRYKNPDNDPRGPWQSVTLNAQAGHGVASQFYEIVAPNGKKHNPPKGRCWIYNQERMNEEIRSNNVWFGADGNGVPRKKKFLKDSRNGVTPETLWFAEEVGTSKSAKKHLLNMDLSDYVFDTPKPEELIGRILEIATDEGDLVLDAYAGSGTTLAVAHKMKREYIGIEIGNQLENIIIPRLEKVIDGENGGISKRVKWKGGGTYDYIDMEEKTARMA